MPDANDMDLVREFARNNSETAFTELVRRHINLVYSVARRCTGNDGDAHDVTQAVFIILARKAAELREKTLLTGWLYETTRFAAARLLRTNARRHAREQEAYMQSTLNEADNSAIWKKLSPHLEAAMSKLAERDRALLVLRFYENKSGPEAAALLGIREDAAHKRVTRAIEKLRKVFAQRGVTLSSAAIAGAVSANSVQAAPVALVKTISAVAVAKGAAATTSTLTLVKGALKIMAWSKAKIAVVAGVVVLLAAGTTTVAVKEYDEYRTYSWEIPKVYGPAHNSYDFGMADAPPQVRIKPSIYTKGYGGETDPGIVYMPMPDGTWVETNYNRWQSLGLGDTLDGIVRNAYDDADSLHTVFLTKIPKKPLYDFISNLPHGTAQPLQELIKKKFGIVGNWKMVETNVLVLKFSNPDAQGLKPAFSLMHSMNITNINPLDSDRGNAHFNQTIADLMQRNALEDTFQMPIVDETGLTNRFDYIFKNPTYGVWPRSWNNNPDAPRQAMKDGLYNQLGLELLPAQRPLRMLVVEKVK